MESISIYEHVLSYERQFDLIDDTVVVPKYNLDHYQV